MSRDKKRRNHWKKGVKKTKNLQAVTASNFEEGYKAGCNNCISFLENQRDKLELHADDLKSRFDLNLNPSIGLDVETMEDKVTLLERLIKTLKKG